MREIQKKKKQHHIKSQQFAQRIGKWLISQNQNRVLNLGTMGTYLKKTVQWKKIFSTFDSNFARLASLDAFDSSFLIYRNQVKSFQTKMNIFNKDSSDPKTKRRIIC